MYWKAIVVQATAVSELPTWQRLMSLAMAGTLRLLEVLPREINGACAKDQAAPRVGGCIP